MSLIISELTAEVLERCRTDENIRTVILTSSRANPHALCDALSDYDLELYVRDISPFEQNDDWVDSFGSVLVRWPLKPERQWNPQWINRLVQYEEGTRIDYLVTDGLPRYHENFNAGYQVLIDKDSIAQNLGEPQFGDFNIRKPTEAQFLDRINAFFWDVLYIPKCLNRGELFYAKYMFSVIYFKKIQPLIEWHIGSKHNWEITTNKYGRYFRQYASPELWTGIERIFAGSGKEENKYALEALFNLVNELGTALASELGFTYPAEQEKKVRAFSESLLSADLSE